LPLLTFASATLLTSAFAHFAFAHFRFAHFAFTHFRFAHFAFTGRERSINRQWNKICQALLVTPQVTQITIRETKNYVNVYSNMANEDGKNMFIYDLFVY